MKFVCCVTLTVLEPTISHYCARLLDIPAIVLSQTVVEKTSIERRQNRNKRVVCREVLSYTYLLVVTSKFLATFSELLSLRACVLG